MSYKVTCSICNKATVANNIVTLINRHIGLDFMLKCVECGASNSYIHLNSNTQNNDGEWERWVKGVYHFGNDEFHSYAFLISHKGPTSNVDAVQISYFKDYRKDGGSLKHGHGPGGTPVISLVNFNSIAGFVQQFSK
jgi:hypothetical protein